MCVVQALDVAESNTDKMPQPSGDPSRELPPRRHPWLATHLHSSLRDATAPQPGQECISSIIPPSV